MDKLLERKLVRKIQNQFGSVLSQYGFIHSKQTFYCKEVEECYLVIHLHKYTFCSGFRIHCAIRIPEDSFNAIALNGPDSDSHRKNELTLTFDETNQSIEDCVHNMHVFYKETASKWFERAINDKFQYLSSMSDIADNVKNKINTLKLLGLKEK